MRAKIQQHLEKGQYTNYKPTPRTMAHTNPKRRKRSMEVDKHRQTENPDRKPVSERKKRNESRKRRQKMKRKSDFV